MSKFNVYMFLNQAEEPLYIGISKTLTTRIEKQHFKSKSGNLSMECIEETHKIKYHQATSSDDMKIKERYLINTLNPKYNNKMNNGNDFNYSISVDWEEYIFNKEELLKKRENNEHKLNLKFRNYNYDFQNQKLLRLNTDRTIRTFCTCLLNHDEYYPNIEFPKRNLGGYNPFDDFYFLKINDELYIFCSEILRHFYNTENPGDGSVIKSIKDVFSLRTKYLLDSFVIVSCKEQKGIFDGGYSDYVLPNQVLFMKYETFKTTGFLDKEWETLLDKGLINFNKPLYEWLLGRFLTKDENEYSEKILEDRINKTFKSYGIKKS